jgi:hypothetical protein
MAVTIEAFYSELHAEHVQEAGLLYEQWQVLACKPGQSWLAVLDQQDRIEAHVDALLLGREAALAVCLRALEDSDPGVLFTAALVCCRQQNAPALAKVLQAADLSKPAQAKALIVALRSGMPDAWAGFVGQSIVQGHEALVPVLVAVSKARGWGHVQQMLARLRQGGPSSVALIDALGQLGADSAEAEIQACLHAPDVAQREAATWALWRMGRMPEQWPAWPLLRACLADARWGDELRARMAHGQVEPDDLLALGLLGQVTHWQVLFQCLGHVPWAESAALALHWATGADLFEEALVPEAVDEQALFTDELQAWREHHKAPLRLDGQPFGERERRLSTDPEIWRAWFTENLPRFDVRLRYRLGLPHSPRALLAALEAPLTEPRLRDVCAQELALRYGCPEALDVGMSVREQAQALGRIGGWCAQHHARFEAGGWWLHGRPQ